MISQYFTYSILLLLCSVTKSEKVNHPIKYKISVYSSGDWEIKEIEITDTVIRSVENANRIKVLNELRVLEIGQLQISTETRCVFITRNNLTEIEPGSFDEQNITHCISLAYNKLTKIRTGTMRNLRIRDLYLTHNKIGYIEKNAITDMPNLDRVYLSSNELVRLDVQSFVNTPNMNWIDLDRNCLTKIGERNFDFMNDTIEMVSARDNRINEIHSQAFEFKTVHRISFDSNKLKNVPEEIWIDSKATVVELEDNELEMLPESFFGHTDLDYVNLRNNPLRCEMVEKLNETVKNMNILIWYDAEQVC
jgi:Leucine-rich repeat (LRR) protein